MTSSSSPGISLKQEGISALAADELPAVIVNIMRGGPGLGNILPSQGDYFQATRGGGHGDYRTIVLAPASVQELADLTMDAFDLADRYRNPVMILADGMIGQMMEPVIFKKPKPRQYNDCYILKGAGKAGADSSGRSFWTPSGWKNTTGSYTGNIRSSPKKRSAMKPIKTDDADLVIVAYGTAARIAKGAIKSCRARWASRSD